MFSREDLNQLQDKGVSPEVVENQLRRFREGFSQLQISAPATVQEGILKLSEEAINSYINDYESCDLDVMKFVPASGAATRMFKNLFSFIDKFDGTQETLEAIFEKDSDIETFFSRLGDFAFYPELSKLMKDRHDLSIEDAINSLKHVEILKLLLQRSGLNYGKLPKGLLRFHRYSTGTRTASEEHFAEGMLYALKKEKLRIHFTISPTHREIFESHILNVKKSVSDYTVEVEFSEQQSRTDTIAAGPDFSPFRDENGKLFFRPAGHGALIENLNRLNADIIFIKNIDNVVTDPLKPIGTRYKKTLAGVLVSYQKKLFELLKKSDQGVSIREDGSKLLARMGTKGEFSESEVRSLLDRPIRVCGMVKNEGEPGGGPFWVKEDSKETLQIVESAQVSESDSEQREIFKAGTHFNPVDLVCGIKNYRGNKYNLLDFRDNDAGFIAEKSYNGEKLFAMELPGLWNGGMSNWNTIFVEVPLETFSPVKTVTDLLKPAHC